MAMMQPWENGFQAVEPSGAKQRGDSGGFAEIAP
jgi:hypothetical protein